MCSKLLVAGELMSVDDKCEIQEVNGINYHDALRGAVPSLDLVESCISFKIFINPLCSLDEYLLNVN